MHQWSETRWKHKERWWEKLINKLNMEGTGMASVEVGGGDAFLESIHLLFTLGKSISLSFPGCTVISAKRRGKRLPASLHLAIRRRFLASAVSTKPRWHAMWNYCWTLLTACQLLGCRLHGLLMPRPALRVTNERKWSSDFSFIKQSL